MTGVILFLPYFLFYIGVALLWCRAQCRTVSENQFRHCRSLRCCHLRRKKKDHGVLRNRFVLLLPALSLLRVVCEPKDLCTTVHFFALLVTPNTKTTSVSISNSATSPNPSNISDRNTPIIFDSSVGASWWINNLSQCSRALRSISLDTIHGWNSR